ncbi:unnamed protein product [Macrosiphum euphorbiae]|uniref:Uncharacterized protein n=1 Tax=Macrosiphum euphorbiae TaxID=13131 RepID=A0AAV0XXA2_9HEMI|nr:unnamed protein product [Macrosiphum euphorbiae]
MSYKNEIETRIKETENCIDELEYQLCDYEDVVAQRNCVKSELIKGKEKLNNIIIEKTNILNELKRETEELSCKYNMQNERLMNIQDESNSLKCENEQILNKLDDHQISVCELNNIGSTLMEKKNILEKELSKAMEITNKLQDREQLTQSEVQDVEQDIICIEKTLTKLITKLTEVEKNINIEQDRYESSQSLICDLKIKIEQISKSFQSKMTEIRCKFNEKSAELCMLKLKLKDKQADLLEQKSLTIQLEEERNLFQVEHCKEKCKIDKEIEELRVELKSIASKLKCVNSKLCDAQMENTKLKCQIKEQNEAIKQLEPKKEKLQLEVKRIKDTAESITEMITAQLKKYENDKQMFDKKLESKQQEQCELKNLSKNQIEQLTKFRKKISDFKCDLAGKCIPNNA